MKIKLMKQLVMMYMLANLVKIKKPDIFEPGFII